jgi:putative CocE/NonD family hydrolase
VRKLFLILASAALSAFTLSGGATADGKSDLPAEVDLIWAAKIPIRDGVRLNATIFKPASQSAPLPAIFTLTPYVSDTYTDRALYFARHGYVYALVDVRGRGNSEGVFEPFENESRDGSDVVEWLARQPWCDGKVAMWGGSYAGFDQWATLKEHPPHLATIVPAAAARAGVDFPFFKNVFSSYVMQWLTLTSGKPANFHLFGESSFWIQKFREMSLAHRPFRELDTIVGNTTTVFQKWLEHPQPDAYWDAMAPSREDYRKIDIPILTITGAYDGDQPGAMSYYADHMRWGTPEARLRHYLIIGPWDHAGTRTPKKQVGGLTFGDASLLDLNDLHRRWYDWTMKGGEKPSFLKKRVAYYVAGPGAEEWKYADDLDSISAPRRLDLGSRDGHPDSVFHSGFLSERPEPGAPFDAWTYDPLDVRPVEVESRDVEDFLTDQGDFLNLFGNGAIYHTEPFDEATEVSGYVRLVAWISLDALDTDLEAELAEILPDGRSVLLTSDIVRARYRKSLREPELARPGEIDRYEFTGFAWFSRRLAKGSRLRLLIRCPNTPALEKNYNVAGDVAGESGRDARTAHVKLWHDAAHRSFLEIPVSRIP